MTTDHAPPPRIDPARHALFLDFDGTLAPIVERPEDAAMPARTHDSLVRLHAVMEGAVALISGRALEDLRARIGGLDLPMAGSHGHEIWRPGDTADPSASPVPEVLRIAATRLTDLAGRHNLIVERKPGAVTVHYRGMPHLEETVREAVNDEAAANAGLKPLHGNMVSEVVLKDAGKGAAIERFLAKPPFAGRAPVMVGDDVTDEHGFEAAQALGGFGIRIGSGASAARYRLPDVPALADWLAVLADRGA